MTDPSTATDFTPLSALMGGAMIGLSAVALLLVNGRMAGVTGMLRRLLPPHEGAAPWGAQPSSWGSSQLPSLGFC